MFNLIMDKTNRKYVNNINNTKNIFDIEKDLFK